MDEEFDRANSSDKSSNSSEMDELEEGIEQEMQEQMEGIQEQEAEGMDEELDRANSSDESSNSSEMDELEEGIEQEMQEQMEGMDEDLNGANSSDDSEDSNDLDELEELNPLPLQPPESIVDDVRAYLPPLTSASLIAERPPVQLIPCDRRADWKQLPIEVLANIYRHLPVSDIHVMGTVFDENLLAGWCERWLEEDLVLHDSQIHYATYKDVKYYIRKHSETVNTLRIDKLVFSQKNVQSWCRELRKPEVTGPSEIVLVNRGSPSQPLFLEPVPEEVLLPFNGRGLKKLHLCFFTLPQGGFHTYAALTGILELGLHGCAYGDDELANGITKWLSLERLTISYASQTMLRVVSHSIRELNLCNSSIRILDISEAHALVWLSHLDLDSTALKLDHLLLRRLTILDVTVNYTAGPQHSQVLMLQVVLNCFPCLQDLTIKRKDNVAEGQLFLEDKCTYILFADMVFLTSHLKVLTFSDFRGGHCRIGSSQLSKHL
ncbi:unnamed protein product [Urochloa humidicola]